MSISSSLTNIITKVANSSSVNNTVKRMVESENFYSNVTLAALVSEKVIKEGFTSTMMFNNKNIPKDKRKFLAIQDLVNCGLAISFTLLLGKLLGTNARKYLTENVKPVSNWIAALSKEVQPDVKNGIGIGLTLLGAIIAQRVLVPLISMPITKKIVDHYDLKNVSKSDYSPVVHSYTANDNFRGKRFAFRVNNEVENWQKKLYI